MPFSQHVASAGGETERQSSPVARSADKVATYVSSGPSRMPERSVRSEEIAEVTGASTSVDPVSFRSAMGPKSPPPRTWSDRARTGDGRAEQRKGLRSRRQGLRLWDRARNG